MLQQDVAFSQNTENAVVSLEVIRQTGRKWRIQQIRSVAHVTDSQEPIQVYRPFNSEKIGSFEMKVIQQEITQVRGAIVTNFEAHGRAVAAGGKLAFERSYEIFNFLIVNVKVAVARHTKLETTFDRHTGKQL